MKQLLIDVGNTNIVFGIHDGNKWLQHWRIHTVNNKTADEYEVILRSLFEKNRFEPTAVNKIIVSSVVPTLNNPIQDMAVKLTGKQPILLLPSVYPRLPVKVLNPYEIGSDLVADALAAHTLYKGDVIVVDFGTALTFQAIDAQGNIRGVSIAPGLKTAVQALSRNTAQLPDVPLTIPPSVLGTNTVHAIQSGVVMGYTGLVKYLVEAIKTALSDEAKVIGTGGLVQTLPDIKDIFYDINPMLTMEGLRIIGQEYL